jgi:hypothetical protein
VKYLVSLKYYGWVSSTERIENALANVLEDNALRARRAAGSKRDAFVTVDDKNLLVRWLSTGWPRQVAEALNDHPRPDVLAAPLMSPAAREAAKSAGVGWVDESGEARIVLPNLRVIVERTDSPAPPDARLGWRPSSLAVCEALVSNKARPTVDSIVTATGLSVGSASTALKLLERNGHLESAAARGRESARHLVDRDALLDAYAAAAERLRSPISIRVGVLWRDPIAGVIQTGRKWDAAEIHWAATSALSASQLAPLLTEISPLEVYVQGKTWSDIRRAALAAGLQEIEGGRLLLRPFPTPAGATLTETNTDGFRSMLWPRIYADLRTTGVRGEDAAEHLREEMSR